MDSCRRRRRPIQAGINTVGAQPIDAPLYACVSGKAMAIINDVLKVEALLDGGSEVCLMPRSTYDQLKLPIDTDINWSIHGYDEKVREEVERKGVIGVCHDVNIDVYAVKVVMPVFVVEHANADLFLGRPWEWYVRAEFINEEDG